MCRFGRIGQPELSTQAKFEPPRGQRLSPPSPDRRHFHFSAIALPIPREAPVTKTTRSFMKGLISTQTAF